MTQPSRIKNDHATILEDILTEDEILSLQIGQTGLTLDFNNVIQHLRILLAKLKRSEVDWSEIQKYIENIEFYRQRNIYTLNRKLFEKLEQNIPFLKSKIESLDAIIQLLKKEVLEEKVPNPISHLEWVIQQINQILNPDTLKNRDISTQIPEEIFRILQKIDKKKTTSL